MVIKMSITKWFLGFICFLFISTILQAQQDSLNIQKKILDSEETDQIIIQRTRSFILNKLKSDNIDEAFEAYNYIIQKYKNEQVKPFWIIEQFLLGYWFGKYEIIYQADSIEYSIELGMREQWSSQLEYLYPQKDKLSLELKTISSTHRSEIIQRLDSLVNNNEKYNFLILFFDWLTFNSSELQMTPQEEQAYLEDNLTPRAEEFLDTYKESRFRPFVQKHFRFVYTLSDWGYAYHFGAGSLSPQSTVEIYLKPEFIFGMGFNLSWKDILMELGFDIGVPVTIRKPFIYEGRTWNTDVRHNYYTYYFAAGWTIWETKLFKLSPQIGIGGINMSVCDNDKYKAGGDFSMTQTAIQYGINYDVKLSIIDSFNKENIHSFYGVKIGFDYYHFLGDNPIMSGGMLRFRISCIGFIRSIIRDMY